MLNLKLKINKKQLNLEAKKKASDFSTQITIKKIGMNLDNDSVENNLLIQHTVESATLLMPATQNQSQSNKLKSEEQQDEKIEERKYINWEQNELEKNSLVLGEKSNIFLARSSLGSKNILSTLRSEQQNAQLSHSDWDSGDNQQQGNKNLIKQEQSQQYLYPNSEYEMPDILNGNNNQGESFNSDNQSDSGNLNQNIYNGDSAQGSKKISFHNASGKEGSIFPKSQNSFYETPYKNSDGKQFDEQYKRNFAHMLLEKTRGLQKHIAGQVVSREAQKIKVYANQVLIWMSIYRIVFSIEAERAKRKLSESDLINEIETRLIDYLNHNPNEKKYKFIKICNRTFRALKIKKCTGDYWLRQIFTKYEHKLNPRIDTAFLLKRLNKHGNQISGFDDDFPVQSNRGSQFLQLRCQNVQKSNRGWFPMDVKEKVIRKIDRSIESAISRIFQQKINQFCVSASQLKKWYVKFGKLQLFNPSTNFYQQEIISTTSKQLQPAHRIPNIINQSVINGPKRAEKQVLNFIKMNPSSTRSRVYSFACNVVQRLGVQQLLNQSNFSSWFNHILTSYCIIFNEYVQLKNNNPRSYEGHISGGTNFQIPITPQIRISGVDSLYNSQNSQMRTF